MSTSCSACGQAMPQKSHLFRKRFPHYGESFGIIGVTQHGKSTWAKEWAAWLVLKLYSVIAWDPADEWSIHGKKRKHCQRGPLRDSVLLSELVRNPRKWLMRRHLHLAVKPDPYPPGGAYEGKRRIGPDEWVSRQFVTFTTLVRSWTPQGVAIAFFIDETNLLFKHAESSLDDIAERWAKDEIVPVFLGQRWMHFTRNMRAQIATLVSFKQVKKSDLMLLAQEVGRDFARALPALEPGSYRVADLRKAPSDALAHL